MAPVGSYESLQAAIDAGADAVYFGVEGLNMRAGSAANFTLDDLRNIVAKAGEAGVKPISLSTPWYTTARWTDSTPSLTPLQRPESQQS